MRMQASLAAALLGLSLFVGPAFAAAPACGSGSLKKARNAAIKQAKASPAWKDKTQRQALLAGIDAQYQQGCGLQPAGASGQTATVAARKSKVKGGGAHGAGKGHETGATDTSGDAAALVGDVGALGSAGGAINEGANPGVREGKLGPGKNGAGDGKENSGGAIDGGSFNDVGPDFGNNGGPSWPSNTPSNSGSSSSGGTCFVAGTPVLTPRGPVAIETLKAGDVTYSMDPVTLQLVPEKVLAIPQPHPGQRMRRVTFDNGVSLEATARHPFFDPKSGTYKALEDMAVGDEVVTFDAPPAGERLALPSMTFPAARADLFAPAEAAPAYPLAASAARRARIVSLVELPDTRPQVYNLTMDGRYHNYLAGGVLVHNSDLGVDPDKSLNCW